jgi:hypothetical protein
MAGSSTVRKMVVAGAVVAAVGSCMVVGAHAAAARTRWTASRCLAANPAPERYRSVPELAQSWMGDHHHVVRNRRLFAFPPRAHSFFSRADGVPGVGVKFPWYRLPVETASGYRSGTLTVTGQRLDGPGDFGADVPSGYPAGFQPTGLHFSTSGCWRVDGRLGRSHLRLYFWVPASA